MKEMSEIKDNYREKYQKIEKEFINEKQKNKNLEKKLDDIYDNFNINLFKDESKTRTHKNLKFNKLSEIELEKLLKLSKVSHQSPQNTHKSISRFTFSTKSYYRYILFF